MVKGRVTGSVTGRVKGRVKSLVNDKVNDRVKGMVNYNVNDTVNDKVKENRKEIPISKGYGKVMVKRGCRTRSDTLDTKGIVSFIVKGMVKGGLEFFSLSSSSYGLLSVDKGTNRKQLRIHQPRKFFRSQLALGCPVDIVEALMDHEGYLTEAYRRYTKAQMTEFYAKNEHLLYISMPKDIQKIESEFKDELNKNRKLIEDLIIENRDLKKENEDTKARVEKLEKDSSLIAEFVEQMKKEPSLLKMLKEISGMREPRRTS